MKTINVLIHWVEAIMKIKNKTLSQSGASAIEFALLLPVLLLFLFGIIEFSILFYNKAMITNASREGARYGITFIYDGPDEGTHPNEDQIIARVNDYLMNADNDPMLISFGNTDNIGTEVDGDNATSGSDLTVTVTYDYDFLILPEFADSLVNLTLAAQTVMRLE
jgi:Flp pilus assembly protein TadG